MRQAQCRTRMRVRAGGEDPAEKMHILGVFSLVLALGLIIVLALVHTHVRYNDVRYQQRALEKQRAALQNEHNELLAQVQELANPERITRLATSELGMVLPADQKIVLLFVRNPIVEADRQGLAQAPAPRTLLDRVLALLGRDGRVAAPG